MITSRELPSIYHFRFLFLLSCPASKLYVIFHFITCFWIQKTTCVLWIWRFLSFLIIYLKAKPYCVLYPDTKIIYFFQINVLNLPFIFVILTLFLWLQQNTPILLMTKFKTLSFWSLGSGFVFSFVLNQSNTLWLSNYYPKLHFHFAQSILLHLLKKSLSI